MKIKQEVLEQLTPTIRNKIALVFGIGEQSVSKWCQKNRSNGPLTRAATLEVIRKELKLTDRDILEKKVPEVSG